MENKVAIVGRPNVGKSTLFNRLIKQRKSIVEKSDGVTRDRIYASFCWRGYYIELIDTGGLIAFSDNSSLKGMERLIRKQIDIAVEEALVTIFVTDVHAGITPLDKQVSLYLKKKSKEVILAVNKVDNERLKNETAEFYQLGFDPLFPVSAAQGLGIGDLLDHLIKKLPPILSPQIKEEVIKIAIVGKPNVGKSSFINSLLGQERMIVDAQPGTTRDSVDVVFRKGERQYLLSDTAGIRRRKGIKDNLSLYSLYRTQQAIERSDVVLILIDMQEGLSRQDIAILNFVLRHKKGCLIAINKKDLFSGVSLKEYEKAIRKRIPYLHFIPIIFISALKGENIEETLNLLTEIADNHSQRIHTSILNRLNISFPHIRIYYFTQVKTKPPKFLVFVSNVNAIKSHHSVYLKNQLREKLNFKGVPIEIEFRKH